MAGLAVELAVDRNGDGDFLDPAENVTADVLASTGIRVYRGTTRRAPWRRRESAICKPS